MLRIQDCLSFKDQVGREYKTDKMVLSLRENAKVYTVTKGNQYLFVRFVGENNPSESVIRTMCDCSSAEMARANVLWPELICYQLDNDMFCGFLAKWIDIPSNLSLLSEIISQTDSRNVDVAAGLNIGLNLAKCIQTVHRTSRQYVIGAPQPRDFHVDSDGHVFFCYAYRCDLDVREQYKSYYLAPEYKTMQSGLTHRSDAFSFAMILFVLLTSVFPFGAHEPDAIFDEDQITDMILNGESVYYYENSPQSVMIDDNLSAISEDISRLFRLTFDYCGQSRYDDRRPCIDDWIAVLENKLSMVK